MTYSRAGGAPDTVKLQSDVRDYVVETTEHVDYTVAVAAATRHGAGPARSRSGIIIVIILIIIIIKHASGVDVSRLSEIVKDIVYCFGGDA